jgi:hypothetical protein
MQGRELDDIRRLQKDAWREILAESRHHRSARILETCPGLGRIWMAQLLPLAVTPSRFSNKHSF